MPRQPAAPEVLVEAARKTAECAMLDRRDLEPVFFAPFVSSVMTVEPAWIDYNGHLNMAYYNVLFDRAVDEVFELLGCGADYVKQGLLHLHRRGARALPARTERGRSGARDLPAARLRRQAHALLRAALPRRGRLGVGHLREHVAACRHGGEEGRAVPARGDAAADPDEGLARPVAAAGGRGPQRGDAGKRQQL